jgi:hypothetical protein
LRPVIPLSEARVYPCISGGRHAEARGNQFNDRQDVQIVY